MKSKDHHNLTMTSPKRRRKITVISPMPGKKMIQELSPMRKNHGASSLPKTTLGTAALCAHHPRNVLIIV